MVSAAARYQNYKRALRRLINYIILSTIPMKIGWPYESAIWLFIRLIGHIQVNNSIRSTPTPIPPLLPKYARRHNHPQTHPLILMERRVYGRFIMIMTTFQAITIMEIVSRVVISINKHGYWPIKQHHPAERALKFRHSSQVPGLPSAGR